MITGRSVAALVIFVLSITFVIRPVCIPIRRPFPGGPRHICFDLITAPVIAIALLWASKCLGAQEIRDGIIGVDSVKPYNVIILFFSLAYMAITLDITGVLQSAAFWVSNKGGSSGVKLFLYFYLMLTSLSALLGNDAVVLSGTAFLVYYTNVAELNPLAWLIAEFLAANTASMVLFVGNLTNVVICEGFAINNAAFTAYTILPFLGCIVAGFIALAFQFRSQKYIQRELTAARDLDVRSVLLDPFGALVGSVLLGSCLVTSIVVSFFGVDVWKVSLPFAVAKWIFDLAWDHYRYVKNIPMLGMSRSDSPIPGVGQDEQVMLATLSHAPTMQTPGGESSNAHSSADKKAVIDSKETCCDSEKRKQQNLASASMTDQLPEQSHSQAPVHSQKVSQIPGARTTILPVSRMGSTESPTAESTFLGRQRRHYLFTVQRLSSHFPTFFTALPRLPFALIPFAFSQFILVEGLSRQGWIDVFASWLSIASGRQVYPTIWLVGVLGVILCNLSGTNVGATILLTKVIRAAPGLDHDAQLAGAIALAVASNIGAVSFTFSASLAGLLWKGILRQKGIFIKQKTFAYWNILPLTAMTVVGLGVVCAQMAVLTRMGK